MAQYVVIGIPVLFWGGTEIQSLTQIQALKDMGYSVTVCCYHEYDLSMVYEIRKTGAKVDLLGLDRAAGYAATFKSIKKYFTKNPADAVHIRYIAPGLLPILAARAAGMKIIFATVGQLGTPYGVMPKFLLRVSALFSKCIICTSQEVEKSWFGKSSMFHPGIKPAGRHCTLHNGIRIDAVAQVSSSVEKQGDLLKKFSIPPDRKLLAVVGRLRSEKGQTLALHAMKTIVAQIPDSLLLFAGDGPDADMLKEKASELGLKKNVAFLGRLDPVEIFALYGIAKCVVIPSFYEGFGLIAVEAMAARVPIVATNVGGLKDIIKDGVTGYLAPVARPDLLALKVLDILRSDDLARSMGEKAYQRANDLFSYQAYFKNMSSLYLEYL